MTEEWESAPDTAPDTSNCVSLLVVTEAYTKRNHSIYISCEETAHAHVCAGACMRMFSHFKVCT